jgi:hypothetical protein
MADETLTAVKKKENRLKELELDRQTFLDDWKEITEYILPNKGLYLSDGEKPHKKKGRFAKIIDATATEDNELLAAGIQGGLSSQSRPWFRLQASDKALMKFEHVAQWLNYVQNLMYSVLAGSNFYTKIHDFYNDEGGFGNAVLMCEPDFDKIVRFYLLTPGQYCFAEGPTGTIDTLYRRYPMRAINVKNVWPNCSDQTKELAKTKPFDWVQIVHAIEPNIDRNSNYIDNRNMPFSSCYWEHAKTEKFLAQGGYIERPFAVGRWKTNDVEAYGTGPGNTALGLVKMLQSMQKSSLKAIHKEVDPPLRVPAALKDVINTLPGGVNPVAANDGREAVGRLFDMNFDYKGVEYKIERVQEMIHTIFKRDLFLLITDRPEMTATEVVERSQEKLIMIGPVTERQIPDVLEPMLSRTFNIMTRFNMIPPPPPELAEQPIKIDYISLLAQAQKMMGLQGMRSYVDMATAVANIKPESVLKTNWNFILDEYADNLALAPEVTVPDEIVAQIEQEQAAREAEAFEAEMAKQESEAVKNIAGAKTDEDNALTAITGKAENAG